MKFKLLNKGYNKYIIKDIRPNRTNHYINYVSPSLNNVGFVNRISEAKIYSKKIALLHKKYLEKRYK